MSDESLILWDVVEEHLDEAEFLFGMWERAIAAPDFAWRSVERTYGERLRAHLDGLVVAGEAAAKRLLVPTLEDESTEASRAAACALALLEMPGEESLRCVMSALATSKAGSATREGVARALTVSDRQGLDDAIREGVYASEGEEQAALLVTLAERGVDPGPVVNALLRSDDPVILAAAARAAVLRHPGELWTFVTALLDSSDQRVRRSAIETSMTWGLRSGWERCLIDAQRGDAGSLEWVGLLGDRAYAELLRDAATEVDTRCAAIRALGFSGRRAAAEECLRWLGVEDEQTAKLAAEAFGAITGVDAFSEGFGAEPEEDPALPDLATDLAGSLEPSPLDGLPLPRVEAFTRWWHEHGASLDDNARYLRGSSYDASAVDEALRNGPTRRYHALRAEVKVRSRGGVRIASMRVGPRMRSGPVSGGEAGGLDFDKMVWW